MNKLTRYLCSWPVIICIWLSLMPAQTTAQNITILHSFAPYERWPTNSDGAEPDTGVIFSSNTLYGTTFRGSPSGYGTVFAVNSDGTGFTSLYAFSGGADGRYPYGLVISGNTLYGTTSSGGSSSIGTASSESGTVFSINIDGSGFTDLYNFSSAPYDSLNVNTNADGAGPGYLIISGGSLYGITGYAGLYGRGTIFSLNTDGSGFSILHNFTRGTGSGYLTNTDGAGPSFLTISSNTLYGVTGGGGSFGGGTVFRINTDGSGFTPLHSFALPSNYTGQYPAPSADGFAPTRLVLSGDILYGRTRTGGHDGVGTIYKLNTDGSGYAILNSSFDLGLQNRSLALVANTLYWGGGTVNTDGTGLTVFGTSVVSGLTSVVSGLIYSGNTLYGTTYNDGMGSGTVFSILVPPKLSVALSGQNILVTWPTNAVGFNLQSATTLANGGDWQDSATVPTQINGQNVVSMGITNPASFYRLRSP